MSLKTWRYASLILAALTLGMSFSHLMEMPARIQWDSNLWVGTTVDGALYQMFGTLGGAIAVGNILVLILLAIWLWRRATVVRWLTAIAALCFVLSMVLFWIVIAPVNAEIVGWAGGNVPTDWTRWRLRWELGHTVNAILQMIGFAALAWSVLEETPPRAG